MDEKIVNYSVKNVHKFLFFSAVCNFTLEIFSVTCYNKKGICFAIFLYTVLSREKGINTVNSQSNRSKDARRPTAQGKIKTHSSMASSRRVSASQLSNHAGRPNGNSDLKNNLRSQTPLNRRMQQKKSAPAEPGTIRRTSKPQYYRIKEDAPHRSLSLLGKRILLVVLSYAVLMPISILLVALWLPHHTTQETNDYIYQVGPDHNYYSRKVFSWDVIRSGNLYYLDMTELADYCEMTTTGNDEAIRYIVKETGETVEFVLGQSIAFINGIQERTGGNAYQKNGKVYVPMDFVNRCFDGIEATVDLENNKITILRETTEDGTSLTLSFPYKPSVSSSPIRFADLDADLQLQILIQNQPPEPDKTPDTNPDEPVTEFRHEQ